MSSSFFSIPHFSLYKSFFFVLFFPLISSSFIHHTSTTLPGKYPAIFGFSKLNCLPYDALNLCLFSFDPCKQLCKPHWVGLTCEGFRFLLFFRYYVLCLWVLELCCFVIVFSLFLIFLSKKIIWYKKNPFSLCLFYIICLLLLLLLLLLVVLICLC